MLHNHAPIYTDEQLEHLHWYNERVQYFLYAATFTFIAILASFNGIYRHFYSRLTRSGTYEKASETTPTSSRLFLYATLATYRKWTFRRSVLLRLLGIGSAGQGAVILGYSIITFSLAISGAYGHFDYIAHHCARICFALIPLLVGLASRELGVLAWATGLHSSTLVALHRWIGRSAIVLASVHVAGRLYTNLPRIDLRIGYQSWGLVGLILWISMSILSIRWIRNRFYKFFIFSHLGAFAMSLIALSLHRPQVAPYIIAGAALYSADRLLRFSFVAYYALRSSRRVGAKATVELLSPDVLRVKVESKRRWKPGHHAYLHAPLIDAGGHPFSIASSSLPISHLDSDTVPNEATQTFIIRVHKGFTLKLKEKAEQEKERQMNDSSKDEDSLIQLSPVFTEGPYGHQLRLHRFESVLLVVGGTGVTFAVGFLLDLVRRARSEHLGGAKKITTKRLTFVWSVRERSEVEWIGTELRDAIHYAPPGFLDLQIYVTRLSSPDSTDNAARRLSEVSTIKNNDLISTKIHPVPSIDSSATSLDSYRSSVSSVATERAPFDYLPTSPTESMLPPISLPAMSHSCSTLVNPSSAQPQTSIEIPLIPGRCRPREIVGKVVKETSYSGSVAVGTCGPSQLTEEVASASSDLIDPSAVYRGESRLNIMLHVESYGW